LILTNQDSDLPLSGEVISLPSMLIVFLLLENKVVFFSLTTALESGALKVEACFQSESNYTFCFFCHEQVYFHQQTQSKEERIEKRLEDSRFSSLHQAHSAILCAYERIYMQNRTTNDLDVHTNFIVFSDSLLEK
jgi:hypothetical protein